VPQTLRVDTGFAIVRTLGEPSGVSREQAVFAVAGIARPQRFFDDLRAAGWQLAGTLAFRDHHAFDEDDVVRIRAEARRAGTSVVLTTVKDAIRFEGLDVSGIRLSAVPLTVRIEPADTFREWLLRKVRAAR
jgi:tetraacyldisaccharide 4'-kinase